MRKKGEISIEWLALFAEMATGRNEQDYASRSSRNAGRESCDGFASHPPLPTRRRRTNGRCSTWRRPGGYVLLLPHPAHAKQSYQHDQEDRKIDCSFQDSIDINGKPPWVLEHELLLRKHELRSGTTANRRDPSPNHGVGARHQFRVTKHESQHDVPLAADQQRLSQRHGGIG